MTDETKAVIDTLYKEFQRINAKSVATDDWFFRFLSIAVVPFLAFLSYCLANPGYRIFVATLPFLSLIGLAVVAVLTTHYLYVGAYGEYLTRRINENLGTKGIREAEFNRACYQVWYSPVVVSYAIGLGMLLIVNVLAVPIINSATRVFVTERHVQQLGWTTLLLKYYWPITTACAVLTVTTLVASCLKVRGLTQTLLKEASMSTDEKAIRDLVAQWHRATAAGDVDAILPLMAEDVVFLVPGGPPMNGRGAFEQGLRGVLTSNRIDSTGEIQELEVSGDLAYCWNVLKVRITPLSGGDPVERSGHALSIFRKQPNGSWVLVRDANLVS